MGPIMYAVAAIVGFAVPAAALLVYAFLIAFYLLWPALAHGQEDLVTDNEEGGP